MSFTESNTVEAYLYDLLAGPAKSVPAHGIQESQAAYGRSHKGLGWRRIASTDIPRQPQEVLVESWVREALIRLNPEIAAQPDRADEVLYKLRAIVLSVRSDGLIRANEEMMAWIRGERSMPFGQNNEHVPVRLIDFGCLDSVRPELVEGRASASSARTAHEDLNQYVVTQQFTFRAGSAERRADLMLVVYRPQLIGH